MNTRPAPRSPMTSRLELTPDRWTQPFWDAGRTGDLVCPRCTECGLMRMPPGPFCPGCRSGEVEWCLLPGTGTIYSYTVVRHAVVAGIDAAIPYVAAVVSLDETYGCRLIVPLVAATDPDVTIGARVRIRWDVADDVALPVAELIGEDS